MWDALRTLTLRRFWSVSAKRLGFDYKYNTLPR
jgi:hypothetical protein